MKEQSMTKGFVILSFATMLAKVLSLIYIPFLKAILGEEGFGVYGGAYQVFVFIFVVTNAGIPIALSKLISELTAVHNYRDAAKVFKLSRFMMLIFSVFLTIIMLIFSEKLAIAVNFPKAKMAILTLSPSILITAMSFTYRGYFQGRGNMTPTAVSGLAEQFINVIFSLIFAYLLIGKGLELGVAGGTIGTTLGALVSMVYLMIVYKKNKKFKIPKGLDISSVHRYSNKDLIKKILYYSIPLTVCMGLTYGGNVVDLANTKARLMAGGIDEATASVLYGYLYKYQQLVNVPIAIVVTLCQTILPAISASVARGEKDIVRQKINYAFRLCFLVTVPSAVGLAVLAEPIYKTIKLGNGSFLMVYGALVVVLMSIVQLQTTILQSLGKLYTATFYSVLGIVCKILVNYFLISIPSINILGAIYGSIIGFIVPMILNHRVIKKTAKVRFSMLRHIIKPLLASILMGAIVYISFDGLYYLISFIKSGYTANALATIISIAIGAFIYLYGLIFTGGIRREDLEQLPAKAVKLIPGFLRERIRE